MVKSKPQERFVRVRDINLRYVDWGDNGPMLLLLHGSMRTSRSWDAMARLLHDRFHVIALDARGH
ncbi:MAG TPA: alpha/beta hydrolase, partial [Dehalococcoidia bacterium]|nr:alpha/beta hydrolase [Dehalococcoidia bacterium]